MGTKVESKTYLPGYFAMADSSVNSNGNWLSYDEESKPSVHVSDSFTITTVNGSSDYDKEMLKRTMLVHEATFRKQVHELHRLYKTQKDLMAQFKRDECNGYTRSADTLQARSYSSQATWGDVKRVWQVLPPTSGHDINHSSINFGKGLEYGQNGAPLMSNNGRPSKKMLDLQLPADAYVDDDDDDNVEILEEKPAKILPRINDSVVGGIVKHNLGNSDGSSHMEKSWVTGLHPQHVSTINGLNKAAEESSSMKMPDFLGVGTSTSQNQRYLSGRVNLNHLSLEDNMREKCIGEASGSNFFGAKEEIKHNNSFNHKKDQNVSMVWFKQEQTGVNFSAGHYLPRYNAFNQPIVAPSSFNASVKSPWQSSNTSYTANSHYGYVDMSFAQNGFFNGFSMDSINTPMATHHYDNQRSANFPGEPQGRKHSPLHDVNLNDAPQDVTAIQEQGSENSQVDISRLRKDPVDRIKSQVQLSCANGPTQILLGSTAYSEGSTRILGFPISAAAEKDSQCLSTLHFATNSGPSTKREADMEMHKKDDTNARSLIDLNAAPLMDEPDIDVHQSKGGTVPQKPVDPSEDSLVITAAESLLAICKDVFQAGSPLADTLRWFADLAIASKEDAMVCSSESESDDDFEALTLQLQETKGYELYLTPKTPAEHKSNEDHVSVVASLLQTKPRRGRARKRPQKKDFQKDILPGLTSLSKHEVSEDLHTLGRSTPSKRGGRNGSQSRGRRRARSVAITIEEVEVSPPPAPVPPSPPPADLDADALGITGWGRTTRRCRRPRCPPANNASLRLA